MSDMSEDERRAAEERIRRIREGGDQAASTGSSRATRPGLDDSTESLSQARSRVQAARESLEVAEKRVRGGGRGSSQRPRSSVSAGARSRQGMLVIGGVVVIGILIVVIIIMLSALFGGGSLPGAAATPAPTATVPPTQTPLPTEGAAPTTDPAAPTGSSTGGGLELALPPLACLHQEGASCYEYCQDPANQPDCDSARQFVRAQNADPDVWFNCVAPEPGPNAGDPEQCLEQAWQANNP